MIVQIPRPVSHAVSPADVNWQSKQKWNRESDQMLMAKLTKAKALNVCSVVSTFEFTGRGLSNAARIHRRQSNLKKVSEFRERTGQPPVISCRLWRRSGSGRRTAGGFGSAAAGSDSWCAAGVLWRRAAAKRRAEPGVLQRWAAAGDNDGEDRGCGCLASPHRPAVPSVEGCLDLAALTPADDGERTEAEIGAATVGYLDFPAPACSSRRGGLPRIPGPGVACSTRFLVVEGLGHGILRGGSRAGPRALIGADARVRGEQFFPDR
jgi:hypothetical protein